MTRTEHETYARDLLSSLRSDQPEIDNFDFAPVPNESRNAANAMTAILCHRLSKESGNQPTRKANTTYEWRGGTFNCRNLTDRDYLWTNLRRSVAGNMHDSAKGKPAAYLMTFSKPSDTTFGIWSIPEPLLHDSLSSLPMKDGGEEYTFQIFPRKQRIEKYAASPDLAPFFQRVPLSRRELQILTESRAMDELVKRERAIAKGKEQTEGDAESSVSATDRYSSESLNAAAQRLTEEGVFDPSGIIDARERTLSSIVRRRGQPAFRAHLMTAYNGRCAITGCHLEPVLDAAHIIPYRGQKTNHPANGLLLRTDLHTLFDLKLVAIDVKTMRLLVSPSLAGTGYDEYQGRTIHIPDDPGSRPSRAALEQHRKQSGL